VENELKVDFSEAESFFVHDAKEEHIESEIDHFREETCYEEGRSVPEGPSNVSFLLLSFFYINLH
jgi:hypothetical protein